MARVLLLCAFLAVPAAGCGGSAAADAVLRFTAIPDHNTTALQARFDPVAAYLSEQLGVPVVYVPATDYPASVNMFTNGDVHLAWFGGLTGLQARQAVPGARAIAQGTEDPKFKSYFIAHADTGLERSNEFPKAIASFKFTFGSEGSTSGRLMPEHFIRAHTGKAPRELFGSEPGFSGSHDKTCEWVESGQYQVGAVNYKTYESRVAAGTTDPEVVRVIWETPEYADYNLTAHPELDEVFGAGFVDRLQKALLGITDPALLKAFDRSGLIRATNGDFAALGEVARALGKLR